VTEWLKELQEKGTLEVKEEEPQASETGEKKPSLLDGNLFE
jgi:hypothetical protein